jgi:Flp pilus assembly protein TadD
MPEDRHPGPGAVERRRDTPDEAETLAALMDGTLTLADAGDEELGDLLRCMDSGELVSTIAEAPKLFPTDAPQPATEARGTTPQPRAVRLRRWAAVPVAAAVFLALGSIAILYLANRPEGNPPPRAASTTAAPPASSTSVAPVAPSAPAALPAPIILTARLEELERRPAATFRGTGRDSRPPKGEGTVIAIEDSEVTVDVGALDGVEKGSHLRVVRDDEAVATVTVARVFRARATGATENIGLLQIGERVIVDPAVQVDALLSAASDRVAAADIEGARILAERAVSVAATNPVPPLLAWRARTRLGTLAHRAGNLETAETHLRAAAAQLDTIAGISNDECAELENELGAVLIARGEPAEAEAVLRRASGRSEGVMAVRVTNNLAAALALQGDFTSAETTYRVALRLAVETGRPEAERTAIEQNLASVRAPK